MNAAMQMRPYQQQARQAIHAEWEKGHQRTLMVLAAGTGKTIVFAAITEDQVRSGNRVLVLAHRGELLEQAADKIYRSTGLRCGQNGRGRAELPGQFIPNYSRQCAEPAASQTAGADLQKIISIQSSLMEAHHAVTDGYCRVLEHFAGAQVLGVTATPDRGDLKNLGEVFDSLAFEYTLPQAIREGYLCPIMAQTIPLKLDISQVAMSGGDFAINGLGTALDPYLDQIAGEMQTACQGRRTVVFLPLIKTSQEIPGYSECPRPAGCRGERRKQRPSRGAGRFCCRPL